MYCLYSMLISLVQLELAFSEAMHCCEAQLSHAANGPVSLDAPVSRVPHVGELMTLVHSIGPFSLLSPASLSARQPHFFILFPNTEKPDACRDFPLSSGAVCRHSLV